MMGAVLNFPINLPLKKAPSSSVNLPPVPPLERLDPEKTKHLLNVSGNIVQAARTLVNFLDANRSVARAAGIEALTVEISGIIDSGHLSSITDELSESARLGASSEISSDGFYYLKRIEKLLAEAHEDLARFTGDIPQYRHSSQGNSIGLGGLGVGQAALFPPIDYNAVILVSLALVAIAIIALALK